MLRNRQGFNLVELMVVIGIFGLLTAISLPAFGRYTRSNRLASSVSRLTSDLQMTRALSIANGRVYQVALAGGAYSITDLSTGTVIANRTMERGVAVQANAAVRFFPWGTAEAAVFNVGCDVTGWKAVNLLPTGAVEVN